MKIFAVYDSKAEAYLPPFFLLSRGMALRSFTEIATDGKSQIFKYPADFTLFELGEYDDSNATFSLHEAKISLGSALEFASVS
nr:MAG: nonstructural protein [Microviridae sp.]